MTGRTYTHPDVFTVGVEQGWAELETDPTRIDWVERQARAALPIEIVNGRPVNPHASTGIRYGRNEMGWWGENLCADAVLTLTDTHGQRWLAMVERGDSLGWALPGGGVDPDEDPVAAAIRELFEETRFDGRGYDWQRLPACYVPDPRASDEAWPVTVPARTHIGRYLRGFFPALKGSDEEVKRAEWIRADSYADMTCHLTGEYGGQIFQAHVPLLLELLGGAM